MDRKRNRSLMPYIDPERRRDLDAFGGFPVSTGELTYKIYKICMQYLNKSEGRFQDRSEVIAALECAKLEFYRRQLSEYEDSAILRNGDVNG